MQALSLQRKSSSASFHHREMLCIGGGAAFGPLGEEEATAMLAPSSLVCWIRAGENCLVLTELNQARKGLISRPAPCRPRYAAQSAVVPVPEKGSNTFKAFFLPARISVTSFTEYAGVNRNQPCRPRCRLCLNVKWTFCRCATVEDLVISIF